MRTVIKKTIFFLFALVSVLLLLITGIQYRNRYYLQRQLADKVLRFHVLAESDSAYDQQMKLKVRDDVGAMLSEQLAGIGSLEACEEKIAALLPKIERTAEETLIKAGCAATVTASLERTEFPIKRYGDYTFPAGSYEALRIEIGEGKGRNWWCVMYPNMCFADSVYEEVGEQEGEALRRVLSEEEYEAVLTTGDYQVKFKYLTFLNELFE